MSSNLNLDRPMSKAAEARARLRETLRDLKPHQRHPFNWYDGLSYQTCRFCRRGYGTLAALWQYSVRHYICDDCKAEKEYETP
jgi:hypothetical protein